MTPAYTSFPQQRSALGGLGISLAVHALLIGLWQLARPVPLQEAQPAQRTQFLRLLPAPAKPEAQRPPPAPTRQAARPATAATANPAARTSPAAPVRETAPSEVIALPPAQPAETPAAAPSTAPLASDLLRDARAAAGAADRAVRRENPTRGIQAPVETAQMKFQRSIARAAELTPNRWYQAPKMEEVQDPGGYGRRRQRVAGAAGTYCVTYESNHAPDGIDSMSRGLTPKITNCDDDDQPATQQKWNDAPPPAHPLKRN